MDSQTQSTQSIAEIRRRSTLPDIRSVESFGPYDVEGGCVFDMDSLTTITQKGTRKINLTAFAEYLRCLWYVTDDGSSANGSKKWYHFNGRWFEEIGEDAMGEVIQKTWKRIGFDSDCPTSLKRNIISVWKDDSKWSDIAGGKLNESRYGGWIVPFRNGIYNVVQDELYPFTPYLFIDHVLNTDYKPMEHHPVEEVYKGMIPDEATRRVLFEAIGYTLYSRLMFPASIFVLVGAGGSGKSTLMSVMTRLIGPGFVAGLTPMDLSEKFGPVDLIGKVANLCTESARDAGDRRIVSTDILKSLSAGDYISVDKKYEAMQSFRNEAKLWFAANSMPDLGKFDDGLRRRVHIFPMVETDWVSDDAMNLLYSEEGIAWLAFTALDKYISFLIADSRNFEDSRFMAAYKNDFNMEDPFLVNLEEMFDTLDAEELRHRICDGAPMYLDELYDNYSRILSESGGKRGTSPPRFSVRLKTDYRIATRPKYFTGSDGKRFKRMMLVRMDSSGDIEDRMFSDGALYEAA